MKNRLTQNIKQKLVRRIFNGIFYLKCENLSWAKAKIYFLQMTMAFAGGKMWEGKMKQSIVHSPPSKLSGIQTLCSAWVVLSKKKNWKRRNKKKKREKKIDQQLPATLQEEFHMELTKGNRRLKAALVLQARGVISDRSSGTGRGGEAGAAVTLLPARKRGKNAWPIRFQSRILSLMDRKH